MDAQARPTPRSASRAVCPRCGQPLGSVQPIEAVASLRRLERRSTILLGRSRRESPVTGGPEAPEDESEWRVSAVLVAANRDLRRLLGEADWPAGNTNQDRGSVWVADAIERLVATIMGATAEDWSRGHEGKGRAVELIWLTVHTVGHQLDDLERVKFDLRFT